MKHKDVASQGHLNFMKHNQATFIFKYVLSVNIKANSKALNPYIPSLTKQVIGFPSYLAVTAFQRDCCCVQSLCNTPCAKITLRLFHQDGIAAQWLSNPPTHRAETEQSTHLLWQHLERYSRYDSLPQNWLQAGRPNRCTDAHSRTEHVQGWASFELQKLTKQKPKRHFHPLHKGPWDCA